MNEISIISPPAIYGEAVAGSEVAETVRNQLEGLIGEVNKSSFDIAELFFKVKAKNLFTIYGFSTFPEYVKTLKIKESRARYLTNMVECFAAVGIPRSTYEPLGITRCRFISSLDPKAEWTNPETLNKTPMSEFIKGFVEKGEEISMDILKQHVRTLKGISGANDMCFLNVYVNREVLDKTIRPALDLARMNIGSVSKDADGMSIDASDAKALEMIAVEYLNDPANNPDKESNA